MLPYRHQLLHGLCPCMFTTEPGGGKHWWLEVFIHRPHTQRHADITEHIRISIISCGDAQGTLIGSTCHTTQQHHMPHNTCITVLYYKSAVCCAISCVPPFQLHLPTVPAPPLLHLVLSMAHRAQQLEGCCCQGEAAGCRCTPRRSSIITARH